MHNAHVMWTDISVTRKKNLLRGEDSIAESFKHSAQEHKIIVSYDTKRIGPFKKTITVSTNQKNSLDIALKIEGTVIP